MKKPKTRREISVESLIRLAREGVARVSPMSRMERSIEELKRKVGQEEMDKQLAALEPQDDGPKACPRCGKKTRVRTRFVSRTFRSLSGTHTVRRHYHYCETCSAGFYPLDEFLGLPKEGALSEDLEMRIADFAVNDPYEVAEQRWNFHYPLRASANQFRQVAKRLGQMVEQSNPIVLQGASLLPKTTPSATLYAMNDGGMVPMREGKWNEVKVGVFFREEDYLSHRVARRGQVTRARYVAVLGGQEEFTKDMRAAVQVENGVKAKRVAWLGDGAPGNWNLASTLCPSAIQILDWYHAVEKGMTCARALLGEASPLLPSWKERLEQLLWAGDGEALVGELMQCLDVDISESALKALNDLIRYYRNNGPRMRYADFLASGLLIGSGVVESAHRHVIQARMKRAGQHWGTHGGRQMARLRATYRTTGPNNFYAAVRWAHRESLGLRLPAIPRRPRASNR